MGGLEIDTDSAVVGSDKKAIKGLYATGELAGGVHGNNRLGGNSLLDCVVFGRVAGKAACQYMLGSDMKDVDLAELSGGGLTGSVEGSKLAGGSYEDGMNKGGAAKAAKGGAAAAAAGGQAGYTMEEVAKHTTKSDCWVVLHGRVLNVTSFLSAHPGGELAIITFGGKDATAEFDMIHPPDVIEKYAPDAVIGMLGSGAPAGAPDTAAAPAGSGAAAQPLLSGGRKVKQYTLADKSRKARMDGHGLIPGWIGALCYMALGFMKEILFTIVPQTNVQLTNDRVGLTRSAMFLFVFIIIHAVGNLHVFLGPDDFNGYGYFYVRLYWTGFGLQANIVEEYVLLCALLHIGVALKRTWDISLSYSLASGKLNLAISGITLLTFMCIHLFQYRFGETEEFSLCPPPYLINLWTIFELKLNLFWVSTEGCAKVAVRDIYRMEFVIFQSLGWVLFYLSAICVFTTHTCLGWMKVVTAPALGIPKRFHKHAGHIGCALTIFVALIYASFPIYAHQYPMSDGYFQKEAPLA